MNNISVAGVLGRDAEQRFLPDGTAVLQFSVADSMGKDKPALWWACSMFGKRGETLCQYMTKGSKVTVAGSVSEREWTDKGGNKRKSLDIRVSDVALQGEKHTDASPKPAPKQEEKAPAGGSGFEDMDDDIPF